MSVDDFLIYWVSAYTGLVGFLVGLAVGRVWQLILDREKGDDR
jgi:hypothetical protein